MKISNIIHIGDILAIPFFAMLCLYFYRIENKTPMEYILFLFSISGFIIDSIFTYMYLSRTKFMS